MHYAHRPLQQVFDAQAALLLDHIAFHRLLRLLNSGGEVEVALGRNTLIVALAILPAGGVPAGAPTAGAAQRRQAGQKGVCAAAHAHRTSRLTHGAQGGAAAPGKAHHIHVTSPSSHHLNTSAITTDGRMNRLTDSRQFHSPLHSLNR